ncbi:MAG: 23S ribosomal RNA methyltransferase Erm [Longimicrobiales bacterium]
MSAKQGRTPRRPELSQHFLRSEALANRLAAQTRISKHDLVLEIGPGRGALTAALARRCRKLIAVELDARLCGLLRKQFRDDRHVSIVQGDFLRFGLPTVPYKVVGSIPFSHTAAIVRRLVDGPSSLTDAHLVTQREAAHRFAGAPYAPESQPSLMLKPDWQVEIVRRLRRTDFDPPPRVDTVVLWLARRTRPLVHQAERTCYKRFVESCFGQGGDTIRKCLRSTFTRAEIRRLGTDLRFPEDAPPSDLTFDQWLGLFRFHALRALR